MKTYLMDVLSKRPSLISLSGEAEAAGLTLAAVQHADWYFVEFDASPARFVAVLEVAAGLVAVSLNPHLSHLYIVQVLDSRPCDQRAAA